MTKRKDRRNGIDRRVAIMSIPHEDRRRILDDVEYMLRHMDGAREYLEEVLAQAQASGFSFDKDLVIK